ncbi:NAD(P)/FAD-dependent oxidoreductase, partial [Mycobacterium sp. ITM-2017-0098]
SNLAAHGIGGLLGFDGVPPAQLYAQGRRELSSYPSVEIRDGEVIAGTALGDGFVLELADGGAVQTLRVLLAMGMRYESPAVPGLA